MARLPRLSLAGVPHHVIHRGNNRQAIFYDDTDRRTWLAMLHEAAQAQAVQVHAYVLMGNHFHLLATPAEAPGLTRMMQALGRRYVLWFNRRHGRSGTLWEGRFRATVLDPERYFVACMRYIELNPVRAGLVERAEQHAWSSAAHHLGIRADAVVTDHSLYWTLGNTPFDRETAWRELLDQALPASDVQAITHASLHGWALGDSGFARQLQTAVTRRVSARPRGRPTGSLGQKAPVAKA